MDQTTTNSNEALPTSTKGKRIIRRELKKRPAFVLEEFLRGDRREMQSILLAMKELQDAGELTIQCDFHEGEIRWVIITRPGTGPISDEAMLELLQWDAAACLTYHNEKFGDGSTKFVWSEEGDTLWLCPESTGRLGTAPKAAACPEAPEASL